MGLLEEVQEIQHQARVKRCSVFRILDSLSKPERGELETALADTLGAWTGGAATPPYPILEGHIRRVFDALSLLQWRSHDQTTPARDGRGATEFLGLLQNHGRGSGVGCLYGCRHTGAAATGTNSPVAGSRS